MSPVIPETVKGKGMQGLKQRDQSCGKGLPLGLEARKTERGEGIIENSMAVTRLGLALVIVLSTLQPALALSWSQMSVVLGATLLLSRLPRCHPPPQPSMKVQTSSLSLIWCPVPGFLASILQGFLCPRWVLHKTALRFPTYRRDSVWNSSGDLQPSQHRGGQRTRKLLSQV